MLEGVRRTCVFLGKERERERGVGVIVRYTYIFWIERFYHPCHPITHPIATTAAPVPRISLFHFGINLTSRLGYSFLAPLHWAVSRCYFISRPTKAPSNITDSVAWAHYVLSLYPLSLSLSLSLFSSLITSSTILSHRLSKSPF